jgi:hypothetical protein
VKQKQRGALADLRRIDCAVGEKPIHSGLSFICWPSGPDAHLGCPAPNRPPDKSKFSLFKPLSLDVIFHDCNISLTAQEAFDAFTG